MCIIKGKNIDLKPMECKDTENIIHWRNQPFVRKWFIDQRLFTKEGHMAWVEAMIDTGRAVQFIIRWKIQKREIGSVYLRDIDTEAGVAELGIFIGEEDCLEKGIGREAVELICAYGFEQLLLRKIILRVLADNKRAIASYRKVGFVIVGSSYAKVEPHGDYRNIIFMAKEKDDA